MPGISTRFEGSRSPFILRQKAGFLASTSAFEENIPSNPFSHLEPVGPTDMGMLDESRVPMCPFLVWIYHLSARTLPLFILPLFATEKAPGVSGFQYLGTSHGALVLALNATLFFPAFSCLGLASFARGWRAHAVPVPFHHPRACSPKKGVVFGKTRGKEAKIG